jgi:uncharacterized SAM-binding protein YcdF (DUF218 family)
MGGPAKEVIVVLGCRVHKNAPSAALERRLRRAWRLSEERPELLVILSGGRKWDGRSESDVMFNWWTAQPAPHTPLCENRSLTTRQNAQQVAELCRSQGVHHVHVVTCDFHIPRAMALFRDQGLSVTAHPAASPHRGWLRFRLQLREWGARLVAPFDFLCK